MKSGRMIWVARWVVGVLLVVLFLVFFCACRTATPAVIPSHSDSVRVRVEYRHDSVYIDRWRDRWHKGDTVYIRDSVTLWKSRYIQTADTICKTDTVAVRIPYERTQYDRATASGFWVLLSGLIVWVVLRVLWRIYVKR